MFPYKIKLCSYDCVAISKNYFRLITKRIESVLTYMCMISDWGKKQGKIKTVEIENSRWALFLFFKRFIHVFLSVLGLHCCTQAFSSCSERGYSLVVVPMLLIMQWLLLLKRTSLAEVGFWYTGFSSCSS